jgi:hypothetical protein
MTSKSRFNLKLHLTISCKWALIVGVYTNGLVFVHHGPMHGEAELADERVAACAADELRRVLDPHVAQV